MDYFNEVLLSYDRTLNRVNFLDVNMEFSVATKLPVKFKETSIYLTQKKLNTPEFVYL